MPNCDRVNYIILFQGRAGSSMLVDVLSRHPDALAVGEILADNYVTEPGRPVSLSKKLRTRLHRFRVGCPNEQQLEMARRFYDDPLKTARAIGFKTQVRDVYDLKGLKRVMEERKVRAIVMERKNLVKQTVSHLNGARLYAATSEWNLQSTSDRAGPFAVDLQEFDVLLREVVFLHQMLRSYADYLDVPMLRLEYADLLKDRKSWFDSVFRFLELEPRNLESGLLKNTHDDLSQVVLNLDELRGVYRGTPFEAMFQEMSSDQPNDSALA